MLSTPILVFIAFFVPPLAVCLVDGSCFCEIIDNLLLTLSLWIPGVAHALYIIFHHAKLERERKASRDSSRQPAGAQWRQQSRRPQGRTRRSRDYEQRPHRYQRDSSESPYPRSPYRSNERRVAGTGLSRLVEERERERERRGISKPPPSKTNPSRDDDGRMARAKARSSGPQKRVRVVSPCPSEESNEARVGRRQQKRGDSSSLPSQRRTSPSRESNEARVGRRRRRGRRMDAAPRYQDQSSDEEAPGIYRRGFSGGMGV